jgi:hypothetical protein
MSSAASSPMGRAGHHNLRHRPSTVRRYTFSTSITTTTSNGSLPRVTLAEWPVPSLSDLHSSNAGSQIDIEAVIRHIFSNSTRNSSSTSAEGPTLYRTSTAASRRAAVKFYQNSPAYSQPMAFGPSPTRKRGEEADISRRPQTRRFLSDTTPRLDPQEFSILRRE